MKRLALLAALLACWAAPALAAIGTPTNIGTAGDGTTGTTLVTPLTAAVSVGDTLFDNFADTASSAWTAFDTGGNTYTLATPQCVFSTTSDLLLFYSHITTAMAAPVTATGSITTTTVTFTTNPGTLKVDQAITGTGVTTGLGTYITGGISQWNGTNASATVNVSQAVVSETLTVSSAIIKTWTANGKPGDAVIDVTGLAASPFDLGVCATASASATNLNTGSGVATGTLHNPDNIIIGTVGYAASISGFTPGGSFNALTQTSTAGSASAQWSYLIQTSSTATVTWNPSWTSARASTGAVWAFTSDGAAGGTSHNLSLLGVGQ